MKKVNNNVELFEKMPVSKALTKMAVPTIMAQLIILIYNMADTFYIGRTGNPYMVAGVSLILPVFNVLVSIAQLTGVGGGTLISRLLGVERFEEARRVCSFSFYVSLGTSIFFSIVMLILLKPVLTLMGADADIYKFAAQYTTCVIVAGGIPCILSNTLSTLVRSVGMSKQAGFGIMMGGVLNIFLDPLFMFVIFPEGWEIIGVGVATVISNCIACAYFFIVVIKAESTTILTLKPSGKLPELSSIKSIFVVGIPSAVATFMFNLDNMVLNRLMVNYGGIALAAIGIVLKVERFPLNVGIGICQGMVPLVAYSHSAGNHERRKEILRVAMIAGIVISIISVIVYLAFAGIIMRIFISEPETVALGTVFLRVRCIAAPLMFVSFFHTFMFNAYGNGEAALFLGVSRWAVFNIPMLFLLNFILGMNGLVWAQITGDVFTVALSIYVRIRYEKRERNRLMSKE